MSERDKSIICVTIAGFILFPAVVLGWKWLVLGVVFFDWLPLATGWMRFSGERTELIRKWIIIHVSLTAAAYTLAVIWLAGLCQSIILRLLLLELWWLGVMAGTKLMSPSAGEN